MLVSEGKYGQFIIKRWSPHSAKSNSILFRKNKLMLTNNPSIDNVLRFIEIYQTLLELRAFDSLLCPCCGQCCWIKWGFYIRFVIVLTQTPEDDHIKMKIQRIRCKNCKATIGFHPHYLVRRSKFFLPDLLGLLECNAEELDDVFSVHKRVTEKMVKTVHLKVSSWLNREGVPDISVLSANDLWQKNICFALYQHSRERLFHHPERQYRWKEGKVPYDIV